MLRINAIEDAIEDVTNIRDLEKKRQLTDVHTSQNKERIIPPIERTKRLTISDGDNPHRVNWQSSKLRRDENVGKEIIR